jgi:hypothetical protein
MRKIAIVFGLLLGVFTREIPAFLLSQPRNSRATPFLPPATAGYGRNRLLNTALASGFGIATNYTWQEEAFEIDVTVMVPLTIKAKDVTYKATSKSIDLRYQDANGNEVMLLDATRKLRGRVCVDGTYWVLSDYTKDATYREITLTIEKIIKTPKDDYEVVDYDWKGVYSNDDEEVNERKYDAPEALDVREYASSLGVDVDNINMSMVDKTMYSSGLNLTQGALDELTTKGYAQEVTRQADGKEFITNDDGEQIPFSPLGVDSESADENAAPKIPFLDTNSPWHQTVPAQVDRESKKTYVEQTRNFTRAAFAQDSAKEAESRATETSPDAKDPIDNLTVKRLQEILKSQGLKSSGSKKELQDRVRQQVNSLLQGKQE